MVFSQSYNNADTKSPYFWKIFAFIGIIGYVNMFDDFGIQNKYTIFVTIFISQEIEYEKFLNFVTQPISPI